MHLIGPLVINMAIGLLCGFILGERITARRIAATRAEQQPAKTEPQPGKDGLATVQTLKPGIYRFTRLWKDKGESIAFVAPVTIGERDAKKRIIGFTGGSVPEEFSPIRLEDTNDVLKLSGIGTNDPYTGLFEIIDTGKGGHALEDFVPSWE